ncbi:MAG: hypothetical protein H6835_21210, partial [Planctomycetes bacterium]|nr:hypothetical protein [Planctomycetota bacterium]
MPATTTQAAPDEPPPHLQRRSLAAWLTALAIGAGVLLAATRLSFLCDDAFITFRYVANAHDGHGLVWNLPPFAPVEGYTCFSWAMLLWAAWSWFGVAPPDAANPLSLALGLALYAVVATAALRMRGRDGARLPLGVAVLTLLVAASNRTFLQWMTSGLETSLFNLLIVSWVLQAFRETPRRTAWLLTWSALAAATALTRPDGLLCVAATAAAAVIAAARRQFTVRATLTGLTPLLAVFVHVGWRRWFYGEWLPNTYFAKIVAPWPEAGFHYLACFAAEHGTWLCAAIALVWVTAALLRRTRWLLRCAIDRPAATAATAAIVAQVAYYVLKVGGDHFEYRVFSHLVPLGALAVTAMAAQLTARTGALLAVASAMLVASSAGWVHFAATRDLPSHGFQPLHKVLPSFATPVARWFDRHQAWLLFHNIGLRCEQHARILERFARPLPERDHPAPRPDPFPVFEYGAVGLVGWRLHEVAILDHHGLNDWVVARTPLHSALPLLTGDAIRPAL